MVTRPEDYPWSSTKAHMTGRDNGIVMVAPLLGLITNWKEFLADPTAQEEENILLSAERTGRPLGDNSFLSKLETILGRALRKRKPGRKSRELSELSIVSPDYHVPRLPRLKKILAEKGKNER